MATKLEKRRITWATAHARADVRGDDADGLATELDAIRLHKTSAEGFVVREDANTVLLAEEVTETEMRGVVLIPRGAILQTWVERE